MKTWTCTTGRSDVVWPKDLLPEVQPRTRVLSFGYSGDIYENPSTFGIRDIARSLLSSLKLRRHSDRNRPIVFLAHCLGGLVAKQASPACSQFKTMSPADQLLPQALCFANNEDEYCSIAKATHSVASHQPTQFLLTHESPLTALPSPLVILRDPPLRRRPTKMALHRPRLQPPRHQENRQRNRLFQALNPSRDDHPQGPRPSRDQRRFLPTVNALQDQDIFRGASSEGDQQGHCGQDGYPHAPRQ